MWDQPLPQGEAVLVTVTPPTMAPTEGELPGAYGMARELETMARNLLEGLHKDAGATPLEKARVMAALGATINTLAKMTGYFDLGRQMLRLPMWKDIERELAEALRPYPAAARAVAQRFAALDRRDRDR